MSSTSSSQSTSVNAGVNTITIPEDLNLNLDEIYYKVKALRKVYKTQQKQLYKAEYKSHSDMELADAEWEELDNKVYYLGKVLKLMRNIR